MKQSLSRPQKEEPSIEISPEADAAMKELVELFSDPALPSRATFRCRSEGPDELDVLIESLFEKKTANTNNGLDAFMSWGLFLDCQIMEIALI